MKRYLFLVYAVFSTFIVYGHIVPQVPSQIRFADMKLHLVKGARKRIQEKVDSLTRSDKYFQALLEQANLFSPIVERVLKEENLPLDFKYLAIQESGLMADAVSTSNAVGFWQFKQATAQEVGLTINQHVDERMHIVAATRAAANYLKQNNREFNNWLYALLAYNEGVGGAKKWIEKKYRGAKVMTIGSRTHTFIIHFLAHKIAFQSLFGKTQHPDLALYEYPKVHGKALSEIAHELGVDSQRVKDHNKWLKSYRVPHDTTCVAIIPMTHQQYARKITLANTKKNISEQHRVGCSKYWDRAEYFPVVTTHKHKKGKARTMIINKIIGVVARAGDNVVSLAEAGSISLPKFLACNDLDKSHVIVPGQVYYYKSKRRKAGAHFHIVRSGETWWSIAQKYGIKKKALLLKNRLHKEAPLKTGRVLWLRAIRPQNVPVDYEYQYKVGG